MVMPKSDTIAAIRRINPTAVPEFLSRFSNDDLQRYLGRLNEVNGRPRELDEGFPFSGDAVARMIRAANVG